MAESEKKARRKIRNTSNYGYSAEKRKELQEKILELLMKGEHLTGICKRKDLPSLDCVYSWLRKDKEFAERYSFSREVAAQIMCDEIIEIADDSGDDWIDGWDGRKLNRDAIERSRLKIDARKWTLAKMMPRKFGNQASIEVTGRDGGAITMANSVIPIEELRKMRDDMNRKIEYTDGDGEA